MDTDVNPKISVLLPVYNAALYLREAIDSILGQTYADFEFLIIDDGSTDTSGEIIASYHDPRIVYKKNDGNLGLVDTLNRGIELARGAYIARMDADDISLPERFARQVAFLNRHPEVGACGTAYRHFGDRQKTTVLPANYRQSFTMLSSSSSLGHPTAMLRRSVLMSHGIRYENEYAYAEDYALWIRIGQVAALTSLPEVLLRYRWHDRNVSRSVAEQAEASGRARILWYELLLGRKMSSLERKYLSKEGSDWKTFRAAKSLISSILANPNHPDNFSATFYGQLACTEWESRVIRRFGIRGLLFCFFQIPFRKRSRATAVGLVAQYLAKHGVTLAGASLAIVALIP